MSEGLSVSLFTSALLVSFVFSFIVFPPFINLMKRLSMAQHVREDGPKEHFKKTGTPTLGGAAVLFIPALIALILAKGDPRLCHFLIIVGMAALLGVADDIIQVRRKRPLGLKARYKFIIQIIIGAILAWFLVGSGQAHVLEIPVVGAVSVDIYTASILAIIALVSTMNAVNLTDGLDGLSGGLCIVALVAYGTIAALNNDAPLVLISACLIGSCMAFLWFNFNPARIFMGDTGSLGLGAAIAVLAVFTRTELFLPIIGGVFVLETLSVIIQVIYFKLTGGKRVFKMSPIHHHYCMDGPPEHLVTVRFWLAGFFLAALGLVLYTWGG
ncbi:MAG: phospho-N-acetylmuramoyl-pentapeptide-transferase [Candidatus Eremiobacteraeota bacterium]|nr:phospho-N-acetylmuramoyl-pentapeptide-transferase [Candidatus Eremiobacteraeota bacterium]